MDVATFCQAIYEMRDAIKALEKKETKNTSDIESLKKENESLKEENASLTSQVHHSLDEISQLRDNIKALHKKDKRRQSEIKGVIEEVAALNEKAKKNSKTGEGGRSLAECSSSDNTVSLCHSVSDDSAIDTLNTTTSDSAGASDIATSEKNPEDNFNFCVNIDEVFTMYPNEIKGIIKGYNNARKPSKFMDCVTGVCSVPVRGAFRFGVAFEAWGNGKTEFYLCNDKGTKHHIEDWDIDTYHDYKQVDWHCDEGDKVWLEVLCLEEDTEFQNIYFWGKFCEGKAIGSVSDLSDLWDF